MMEGLKKLVSYLSWKAKYLPRIGFCEDCSGGGLRVLRQDQGIWSCKECRSYYKSMQESDWNDFCVGLGC